MRGGLGGGGSLIERLDANFRDLDGWRMVVCLGHFAGLDTVSSCGTGTFKWSTCGLCSPARLQDLQNSSRES